MIAPVLPTVSDLEPWISKLEQHPGSIVLLALETFQTRNDKKREAVTYGAGKASCCVTLSRRTASEASRKVRTLHCVTEGQE